MRYSYINVRMMQFETTKITQKFGKKVYLCG